FAWENGGGGEHMVDVPDARSLGGGIAIGEVAAHERTQTAVRPRTTAKYRPDVDGLRAIAVLSVLFYHGGVATISGGYIGVGVFFVISGFVIAPKLMEEIEDGGFSLAGFYVRRIRRILPALTATVVLTFVAALAFFLPDAMKDFSKSVIATGLFGSNLFFW